MKPIIALRDWILVKIKHSWNKNVLVTPRVSNYVDKLVLDKESPSVKKFYEQSLQLPMSHMQTEVSQARFLMLLVKAVHAKRILEIGTFRGFSAIHLAEGLSNDGQIVTCELSPEYAQEARNIFSETGMGNKIRIEEGPAIDTLSKLVKDNEKFDMIFIDADKENYKDYFIKSRKLISPGGIILIDNVLWGSLVTFKDSSDPVAKIMRSFNEFVFAEMGKNAVIIPAWDGMMVVIPN
ncbi:MAG: O-methyltransferase [Candidatus Paceibacterota bacterium]|jgi:predicted O-methyltransferase YrrM